MARVSVMMSTVVTITSRMCYRKERRSNLNLAITRPQHATPSVKTF